MAPHLIRGETETAVDWLEEAVERGFRIYSWLEPARGPYGSLPGLDRRRENDRYRRIVSGLATAQDSMREIAERRGC